MNAKFEGQYTGEFKNIIYKYGSKYGLAERYNHNIIVKPFADYIGTFNDYGLAFYEVKGLVGIVNNDGEIIKQPTMTNIAMFNELRYTGGLNYIFGYYDTKEKKWGVIDNEGRMLISPKLPYFHKFISDKIFTYSDNASSVYNTDEGQKLKLMNINGEIIDFPAFYSFERIGENHLFKDVETNLYGIANKDLEIIEEPFIKEFVKVESKSWTQFPYSQFDLKIYKDKDDIYGFLSEDPFQIKKSFASELKYWWKNRFLFRDKETGKVGIITTEFDIIIPPLYNSLSENLASDAYIYEVDNTDKKGIININGNKTEPIFQKIMPFVENYSARFKLSEDGYIGMVNTDGEIIKEPFACLISSFDENGEAIYQISPGASNGIINVKGEIVLESKLLD